MLCVQFIFFFLSLNIVLISVRFFNRRRNEWNFDNIFARNQVDSATNTFNLARQMVCMGKKCFLELHNFLCCFFTFSPIFDEPFLMQLICIIKSNFPVFNYLYSNCMPEKKVLRSFDHRSNIQRKKLICIPLATIAYHTSNPQKTQVVFSLLLHSPRHRMAKMVFVWLKFESMLISLPVCLQNSSIYNIKKKSDHEYELGDFFFFFLSQRYSFHFVSIFP